MEQLVALGDLRARGLRIDDLAGSVVCVPLWSFDEVIGVFRVATGTAEISPAALEAIGLVADRMGLVFSNLRRLQEIERRGLREQVDVRATFCFERCDRGPTVTVGDTVIERCTVEAAIEAMERKLAQPTG